MRLQVELVHAEVGVRVVLVTAWSGSERLGSALGEAADAEEAERRAEQRLLQRLGVPPATPLQSPRLQTAAAAETDAPRPAQPSGSPGSRRLDPPPSAIERAFDSAGSADRQADPDPPPAPGGPGAFSTPSASPRAADVTPEPAVPLPPAASVAPLSVPAAAPPEPPGEPAPDPEDWSDDLARIDLQLLRLGWDRGQEALYLERAFGHPSRSRLTRYGDLVAYLQALSALEVGADPAQVPLPMRRRDLLEQCDDLLGRLGWDPDQGRLFLELNFQCASRQHLSDQQLLQFNMLLEEQWLQQASTATA